MVTSSIPSRGDIITLQFNPQQGREQAGRRPAYVLSPRSYNEKVGLIIVCPITQQMKGFPFEVQLPASLKTKGVILTDHIKSIDWNMRGSRIVEQTPLSFHAAVMEKLDILLN